MFDSQIQSAFTPQLSLKASQSMGTRAGGQGPFWSLSQVFWFGCALVSALVPAVGQASTKASPAQVTLGQQLFFDPRLSKNGAISCNSCHNVMAGGVDQMRFSAGVGGQLGGRNAPTVWNAAFLSAQFWDGRAATLEDQAKGPLVNPVEMGMENHDAVVARVRAIPGYVASFEKAFGGKGSAAVNIDRLAQAIASYERTLVTTNSAFDRFQKGQKSALSAEAQKGWALVQSVGCTSCHSGAHFAGPPLPVGTGFYQKFPMFPGSDYEKRYDLASDLGRYEVTKKDQDKNFWRVPTWRNVGLTAPYFHNGSVPTLDEAVRVMAKTQLNKSLAEDEVSAIVAFLNSLTGPFPVQKMPRLPETPGKTVF